MNLWLLGVFVIILRALVTGTMRRKGVLSLRAHLNCVLA